MADKKKNFKAMADDELKKELDGLSKSLHGLRAQTVTSTVENKSQFRSHRRDIARILTEIRARELKEPVRGPKPAVVVPSSAQAAEGKPPPKPKAAGKRSTSAKAAEDKASAKS
jgi:large subunit ribosomal protein L29